MPISAQEWRARTGVNNAGRVCRPVSSSASSGKWEGVTVGRGVCVPGPLLYKACTLVLLMLLLLAGISDHEPGGQINIGWDPELDLARSIILEFFFSQLHLFTLALCS